MDRASFFKQGQLRSLEEALRRRLSSHIALVRFVLVGGSGYVLYQAILFLVYDSALFWFLPAKDTSVGIVFFEHADVRFLITTLLASALSLVFVFTGHNLWTFRDRDSVRKPLWMRFGQFLTTVVVASGIILVTVNVLTVQFDLYHFLALPVGVALGGVWDWLWYSRFVWRRAKKTDAGG
jgi:putative flippase GtrA